MLLRWFITSHNFQASDTPPELPSPPDELPHGTDSPDEEFVEAERGDSPDKDDDELSAPAEESPLPREAVAVAQ